MRYQINGPQASQYFGYDKDDSRLIHLFFFD